MKKTICLAAMLCLFLIGSYAGELSQVIPPEDGMIEYYIFIDRGWGLDDPYSYDWDRYIDDYGDEYVIAVSDSIFPTVYIFYSLPYEEIEEELDYWALEAMGLMVDNDADSIGMINDEFIYLYLPNDDYELFPYSDYIGYRIYFTDAQRIPYTKFNMVMEYGPDVIEY